MSRGYRPGRPPAQWDAEATDTSARADGLRLALRIAVAVVVLAVVVVLAMRWLVPVVAVVLVAYLVAFGRRGRSRG